MDIDLKQINNQLKEYGVSIMYNDGTYKRFNEVLDEISVQWNYLNKEDKNLFSKFKKIVLNLFGFGDKK